MREYPPKAAKLLSESTGISHEITTSIVSKVSWDAAVYKQDLETFQNLSVTGHAFSENLTGSHTNNCKLYPL